MKKMNKKGFTLIELLAVIIIMGVLLLIAVPSVSRYIENSRKDTYAANLVKYADAVSAEVNSYTEPFTVGADQYLVVPITCIDLESGSSTKSPFSNYVPEKSYIVVMRNSQNGFDYKVAAVDNTGFGTGLVNAEKESITIGNAPAVTPISGTEGNYTISLTGDEYKDLAPKVAIPSTCNFTITTTE